MYFNISFESIPLLESEYFKENIRFPFFSSAIYIMNNTSSYLFNSMGRIGADMADETSQNLYNTRFGNYTVSNFFSDSTNGSHINFATQQPTVMINAKNGIASGAIDHYSFLLTKTDSERPLEKLCLNQRPFITVPYLGKGYGDPTLEAQLQQGQMVADKKSVTTVSETSYIDYSTYPMMDDLRSKIGNAAYSVQEAAMDGWVRGGSSTRETITDSNFSKNARPRDSGY